MYVTLSWLARMSKPFAAFSLCSSVLHNYFDSSTKWFSAFS